MRGMYVCDIFTDIMNYTIRLDDTAVPAVETTYICQIMDTPDDKDYHLVAAAPYIENIDVMHHILAYGCQDNGMLHHSLNHSFKCIK